MIIMNIYKPFIPPVGIENTSAVKRNQTVKTNHDFSSFLQDAIVAKDKLTISKHAQYRLEQRNIEISSEKWNQIGAKLEEARQKGVKESLVILDNAALIVSAQNKTVITAMDRNEAASQIFTNINGAIIL
jgi:flagellar operon protein